MNPLHGKYEQLCQFPCVELTEKHAATILKFEDKKLFLHFNLEIKTSKSMYFSHNIEQVGEYYVQ